MAVLSWNNWVDSATITNNSAAESPVNSTESISFDKVKNRQIGDVGRQTFTSITSPLDQLVLDFDLGAAKATDLFCVLNHNMGGYAYTISFGTSQGDNSVGVETGTFWDGTSYHPDNEMLLFSSAYTARYVRLAVAVPAATTCDIGRVWMDSAWSYSNLMDFSISIIDRSVKSKSRGGSSYVSSRQKLREINVTARGLSNDNLIGATSDTDMKSFLTMDLAVGSSGEIICLPAHASQHERQTLGVYGTISRNGAIQVIDKGGDGWISTKRFTIEEDRG